MWEIKTVNSGSTTLQDIQYTWDAAGNLSQREDMIRGETANYTYDFLDRLTGRSSQYVPYAPGDADGSGVIDEDDIDYLIDFIGGGVPETPGCDANQDGEADVADITAIYILTFGQSFSYDEIGNLTAQDGLSRSYGSGGIRPHAVTELDSSPYYTYDDNGNMVTKVSDTMTWDVENRLTAVTGGAGFVYDACMTRRSRVIHGDGNRVMKTENGETVVYINKYFEKNITTGDIITSYYLGGKLVAQAKDDGQDFELSYILQDHLGSTTVTADDGGDESSTAHYS
ncbi:MAG: hypothetical protein JXA46_16175, partial [Dehalococcoidales bacterium]|nr:hypothetical protein [Dehalococcoidales bacterium]